MREPQLHERLGPHLQPIGALERQMELPISDSYRDDVAVVAKVYDRFSWTLFRGAAKIGDHIKAVEMDVELLAADRAAVEQLLRNVRISGGGQQCREHVDV